MLELLNISKSFGGTKVLDRVNLSVRSGEALCVAGANAAGKTTLLTIAASLQKSEGIVKADGRIGYVPQEPALFATMTAKEHLILWYAANRRPEKDVFSEQSVEMLLGLRPYARKKAEKLSGGIRKRLSIACSLAGNPDYVLLDEPFNALDLQTERDVLKFLGGLKQQGKGVLFTSHNPSAIAELADRVLLLRGGVFAAEARLHGTLESRTAQVVELLAQA